MICGVQRLRLPLQQAYTGPANKLLKTHEYSDSISKNLLKPIHIASKFVFASSNFLKTHANRSKDKGIFKKTIAFFSLCRLFSLKPRRVIANTQTAHPTPESNFFPFEPPALRGHLTHALTQLRTHARTHAASLARTHARSHARLGLKGSRAGFPVGLPPQPPINNTDF